MTQSQQFTLKVASTIGGIIIIYFIILFNIYLINNLLFNYLYFFIYY